MADDRRVFSEQEVGEIVQRAAELQEASPERGLRYAPGVTREQLERVAQEVGVEPEFLQRALAERSSDPERSGLFRAHERVVDGELDPNDFDLILEHVRARRSRRSPTTQIGRTLEGRVWTGTGFANLEVTSRNDRTRVRVKPTPIVEILGTFYPAFLASLAGAVPLASNGHGVASAVVAAGLVAAATLGFFGWTRRSNRSAKRLANKLAGVVAEEVARQSSGEGVAESAPGADRRRLAQKQGLRE
jgi:hypothetical protein